MFQQTHRIADLLHVEHDDVGGFFWIESLVQMFEHILDTELRTVTDCPHAVEFQTVAHAVFLDEHGRGTGTGDEIDALGVEFRDRRVEATAVVGVQEARAVGADERTADTVDRVNDMFWQLRPHGQAVHYV